jgi:hypothetical protein
MNWDEVGAIGQVLGSIAVFVTLVYLSIQTNHARREAQRALLQSRSEAIRELQLHAAANPDLIAKFVKVHTALGGVPHPFMSEVMERTGVSLEDAFRLFFWQMAWMQYPAHLIQHADEIPPNERAGFDGTIRNVYGRPGIFQHFYATLKTTGGMNPEVVRYIDNLLAQPR